MKDVEKALKRYYEPLSGDPGIIYLIRFLIDYVNYIKREPLLHNLINKMIEDDANSHLKSGLPESWNIISKINTESIDFFRDYSSVRGHEEFDVKVGMRRIHNYLLEELSKEQSSKSVIVKVPLRFDEVKAILFIGNKGVKFRKFTEQYHTLRIILSDASKLSGEWFFSEIREQMDEAKGYTDKDFHNYFSAIKRRVAAEAGIKDLFLTTTQSVRINPDYLKI